MRAFYLSFPSLASATEALTAAGLVRDDGGFDGNVDAGGRLGERPDGTFLANLLCESLHEALVPYEVHPATPDQVFAGHQ